MKIKNKYSVMLSFPVEAWLEIEAESPQEAVKIAHEKLPSYEPEYVEEVGREISINVNGQCASCEAYIFDHDYSSLDGVKICLKCAEQADSPPDPTIDSKSQNGW
jgi:formylmethanofuran dehydrogenase subunit E